MSMLNDDMDWVCKRVMMQIRKEYHGHRQEIHAKMLVRFTTRFEKAYGIKQGVVLDALIRRNWFEPIGSDSYAIHYWKLDE